jgi:folate-binding protein YgfZ
VPGAVAADPPDAGVAAHYGDPLREQRLAERGAAVVDRSHRGVVTISGPDRLSWLHSLTSQHLAALPPMRGTEALVLSPHGHVEHHLVVADDGERTIADVEPGTTPALLRFLDSMRFLLRVCSADAGPELAVASVLGPRATAVAAVALGFDPPWDAAGAEALGAEAPGAAPYPLARASDGVLVRWMPYGLDVIAARAELVTVVEALVGAGAARAGVGAFEANRILLRRARLGVDTDHRTIPHEVGYLATAVHLDKGCYRGQETVARVQNLGRPPRRMVLLHLDGTAVAPGSQVLAASSSPASSSPAPPSPPPPGRAVGFVGSSAVHYELGPLALALLKRTVPDDAELVVRSGDGTTTAASVETAAGPVPAQPIRPAGHLRHPHR